MGRWASRRAYSTMVRRFSLQMAGTRWLMPALRRLPCSGGGALAFGAARSCRHRGDIPARGQAFANGMATCPNLLLLGRFRIDRKSLQQKELVLSRSHQATKSGRRSSRSSLCLGAFVRGSPLVAAERSEAALGRAHISRRNVDFYETYRRRKASMYKSAAAGGGRRARRGRKIRSCCSEGSERDMEKEANWPPESYRRGYPIIPVFHHSTIPVRRSVV